MSFIDPNKKTNNPKEFEMKPMGGLGNHKVTDQTQTGERFEDFIPKLKIDPKAHWDIRYKAAKEKGAKFVIWLIISAIFPFVKPPELYKELPPSPVGKWQKSFEQLKKAPLDKAPILLFNYYTQLGEQIKNHESKVLEYTGTSHETAHEQQIKDLKQLQADAKGILTSRLEIARKEVDQKMPIEELEKLAEEAKIALPEGTFGEKREAFLKEINTQRDTLQKKIDNYSDEGRTAGEGAKKLHEKQKKIPQKLIDLKAKKERNIASAKETNELERQKAQILISNEIEDLKIMKPLEEREQALLKQQKGGIFQKKFTEKDLRELENIQEGLEIQRKENVALLEKQGAVNLKAKENEQKLIHAINEQYLEDDQYIKKQNLTMSTEILELESKRNTAYENSATNQKKFLSLDQTIQALNKAIEKGLSEKGELKADIEKFIHLKFFAEAFEEFQSHKTEETSSEFIAGKAKEISVFSKGIKKELQQLGIPNDQLEAVSKAPLNGLAIINNAGKEASELGLEQFL